MNFSQRRGKAAAGHAVDVSLSSSSDQTQTQGGAGGKRLPPEPPQAWSYREELQLPQSLICQLVLQSDMMESFKVSSSRKVWWWALSLSLSIWSTADKWLTYRLRYWLTWTQTHTLVSSHIILLITHCLLFLMRCGAQSQVFPTQRNVGASQRGYSHPRKHHNDEWSLRIKITIQILSEWL